MPEITIYVSKWLFCEEPVLRIFGPPGVRHTGAYEGEFLYAVSKVDGAVQDLLVELVGHHVPKRQEGFYIFG